MPNKDAININKYMSHSDFMLSRHYVNNFYSKDSNSP